MSTISIRWLQKKMSLTIIALHRLQESKHDRMRILILNAELLSMKTSTLEGYVYT